MPPEQTSYSTRKKIKKITKINIIRAIIYTEWEKKGSQLMLNNERQDVIYDLAPKTAHAHSHSADRNT